MIVVDSNVLAHFYLPVAPNTPPLQKPCSNTILIGQYRFCGEVSFKAFWLGIAFALSAS
ncbi:hypothetical protein [Nitrosomonas sp. H1_AOB3]|uniref:hypothetical protein n=1 Tax=Nitrosomonas sp. H1_AOB3 TaxID=2741553 RepID=UPI002580319F|nr:hypothetical protein [Nitrosomonas sp. H1_AOB3]